MPTDRHIAVEVMTLKDTGLMVAVSDDLPGLLVHGRSLEDLEQRLPVVIRELLEAQDAQKVKVTADQRKPMPKAFTRGKLSYSALSVAA